MRDGGVLDLRACTSIFLYQTTRFFLLILKWSVSEEESIAQRPSGIGYGLLSPFPQPIHDVLQHLGLFIIQLLQPALNAKLLTGEVRTGEGTALSRIPRSLVGRGLQLVE